MRSGDPKPAAIPTLYGDDDLLAINKPAGLSVTKPRAGGESLIEALQRHGLAEPVGELRLVHRLDRYTSGVLVLARHADAQRRISEWFQHGRVSKCYWALVAGQPQRDEGLIDLPIGPAVGTAGLMRVDRRSGKPAQTAWRVLERFVGLALLECRPLTGRTHQIRVHLQAAGMPLRVDLSYGGGEALLLSSFKADYRPSRRHPERPLIDRLTLHARALTLPIGEQDRPLTIEAPLPRDFKATLNQLRKHAWSGGPHG